MLVSIVDLQGIILGSQSMRGVKLDARTWLAVIRIQRLAQEKIQDFEQVRIKLCEQYARKDENGNPVTIIDADKRANYDIVDMAAFQQELAKLQDEEIEVPVEQVKIRLQPDTVVDNPDGLILLTILNIDGDSLFE